MKHRGKIVHIADPSGVGLNRFYLVAFTLLGMIQFISLVAHFFGPSPYGGSLVVEPLRMLPEATMINLGILGVICLAAAILEGRIPSQRASVLQGMALGFGSLHLVFGQFDLEIVRWMGQHLTLSFLSNFFGIKDGQLLARILSSDLPATSMAVVIIFAGIGAPCILYRRRKVFCRDCPRWSIWAFAIFIALLIGLSYGLRHSDKRWRRVRPAVLGITYDVWCELNQASEPINSRRATADLVSIIEDGRLSEDISSKDKPDKSISKYPLLRRDNLGKIEISEFKQLARTQRPNIVMIVFETMRGWETGLHPNSLKPSGTPKIDEIVKSQAYYFPLAHSNGFPSVEGCMSIHLGLWPHVDKIFFTDFLHANTRSIPEILRGAGYQTFALLGADPSFSNFTPWFRRWYDAYEYDPDNYHDGPLADRFIEKYQELARRPDDPLFMTLWTATTHPPYDVPPDSGETPAETTEERYDQAIRYADNHIARVLTYLQQREDWDNTIVLLFGDHAQPSPYQRSHPDQVCSLSPGHTWTNLAFFGGWPGLPKAERRAEVVSHIDIATSLFNLLNLRVQNHFMGRNLLDFSGKPMSRRAENWPVFSFRYTEAVLQRHTDRVCFSPSHDDVVHFDLNKQKVVEYGLLDGHTTQAIEGPPKGYDLARYRDLIRAYGRLLEGNRILPPEESGIPQ